MYVTQQGMIDRYGERTLTQLTDRGNPPTGWIVSAVLDGALHDAATLIHGYARSAGYQVPFALPAPDPVPLWQALIALYMLHQGGSPSEELARDYERTLAQLRDMAAGRLALQAGGVEARAAEGETVQVEGPGRAYTRESLAGF